jgi:hypothetical protein
LLYFAKQGYFPILFHAVSQADYRNLSCSRTPWYLRQKGQETTKDLEEEIALAEKVN